MSNDYQLAYEREKLRRQEAERLLEEKTHALYNKTRELEKSYEELQRQQAVVIQNEKMATIGTLSSGVAHEINNPLAYVLSNVESLKDDLHHLLDFQDELVLTIAELTGSQASVFSPEQVKQLETIRADMPELIEDIEDGLIRIRDVVNNLRRFARTQSQDYQQTDLVEQIENTLKLLQGSFKHLITINTELNPLPSIQCKPNEINQVILNLLINAQQACEATHSPTIRVCTYTEEDQVVVEVADNGSGMTDEVKSRIFEPFFTTKGEGQGTGMGLAISYGIIKEHNGAIEVESEIGKGTCFKITLPRSHSLDTHPS